MTAQWNNYYNGSASGSGFLARFARGTKDVPLDVQAGDRLGFNVFGGWAGGAFRHTAGITAAVDTGTVSATSLPTYLAFTTTPNGSIARAERMRITSDGSVAINTTTPEANTQLTVYSAFGTGVYGRQGSSGNYGTLGASGSGVSGTGIGSNIGVSGTSTYGNGVNGASTDFEGVCGQNINSGNFGTLGASGSGVSGTGTGSNIGVSGTSTYGTGVYGLNSTSGDYGILGASGTGVSGTSAGGTGVYGASTSAYGVSGNSTSSWGVYGQNMNSGNWGALGTGTTGVSGLSDSGYGVGGVSTSGRGVYGSSTTGYAGYFNGNVHITGTLTKGVDSFKIDHPQDPENRYLVHSVIESPDMKNVYDGTILLDGNGEALVELPAYFEALNRDFRYQLTCIGEPAVLYIAEEISGNHFRIAGGKSGMKVSWQVTGIRQDAFANAHPIVVEQEKPVGEKGLYLHPVEWGQPKEKGIGQALNKSDSLLR
jgi:hypothetical protein